MGSLSGKVAWVTGAGSGIGEAAAIALAGAGATAVLTGRRPEALEAVAARIRQADGSAEVEPADVTDAARVNAIAKAIQERHGRLDIVVNNAGNNLRERRWVDLNPERIRLILDANLTSAFYVASAALPIMRAQKDGVLIHTASWAGRHIGPVSGPGYVAAKLGMVAMSHTINLEECQNGIRSSVLCPGD